MTREYRLVRDFNFITLYEVSRSVLGLLGVLEQILSLTTETNSLTFLLLLLRRYVLSSSSEFFDITREH